MNRKANKKELSCDHDGSGTEAKNCVNNPNSDNLHLNNPRNEEDKLPCSSDKVEVKNVLQDKFLSLNLSEQNINFILEQGDKFLEQPPLLLARKLNMDVDNANQLLKL